MENINIFDDFRFVEFEPSTPFCRIPAGHIRLRHTERSCNSTMTIPADYSRELTREGFRSVRLAKSELTGTMAIVFLKDDSGISLRQKVNRKNSTLTVCNIAFTSALFKFFDIKRGETVDLRLLPNRSVRKEVRFHVIEK